MSIAIIRGPQSTAADASIPGRVISTLVEHASRAGKTIALRTCRSEAELMQSLHFARLAHCEFVIFDPGACACNDDRIGAELRRLGIPYIEVHDDHYGALERVLTPGCGPRLELIHGYGAQSYTLALSAALEHLGCAEWENDIHVGT